MARSDCWCLWPDDCGGSGWLLCAQCGGERCVCRCGGEQRCTGCDSCALAAISYGPVRYYYDDPTLGRVEQSVGAVCPQCHHVIAADDGTPAQPVPRELKIHCPKCGAFVCALRPDAFTARRGDALHAEVIAAGDGEADDDGPPLPPEANTLGVALANAVFECVARWREFVPAHECETQAAYWIRLDTALGVARNIAVMLRAAHAKAQLGAVSESSEFPGERES